MFAFKYSQRTLQFDGREVTQRRLEKVMPSSIVDGLFSRFTVTARGDAAYACYLLLGANLI
jgi:hypothetical protein